VSGAINESSFHLARSKKSQAPRIEKVHLNDDIACHDGCTTESSARFSFVGMDTTCAMLLHSVESRLNYQSLAGCHI